MRKSRIMSDITHANTPHQRLVLQNFVQCTQNNFQNWYSHSHTYCNITICFCCSFYSDRYIISIVTTKINGWQKLLYNGKFFLTKRNKVKFSFSNNQIIYDLIMQLNIIPMWRMEFLQKVVWNQNGQCVREDHHRRSMSNEMLFLEKTIDFQHQSMQSFDKLFRIEKQCFWKNLWLFYWYVHVFLCLIKQLNVWRHIVFQPMSLTTTMLSAHWFWFSRLCRWWACVDMSWRFVCLFHRHWVKQRLLHWTLLAGMWLCCLMTTCCIVVSKPTRMHLHDIQIHVTKYCTFSIVFVCSFSSRYVWIVTTVSLLPRCLQVKELFFLLISFFIAKNIFIDKLQTCFAFGCGHVCVVAVQHLHIVSLKTKRRAACCTFSIVSCTRRSWSWCRTTTIAVSCVSIG